MSVKTFFQSTAPVTLRPDDPQLQRILNDPEYQRLWAEQDALAQSFTPERQQQLMAQGVDAIRAASAEAVAANQRVKDRFAQLGGLPDNHYIVAGPDGQPRILRKTTTAGAVGRLLRQTAIPIAGVVAAPIIAGAVGAGAGGGGAAGAAGATGATGATAGTAGGLGTTAAVTAPSVAATTGGAATAGTAGAATAGTGGALSSYLASNAGDYTKAGLTMAGAAMSGQRGLTIAQRDLIKKRLEEYNRTQPQRQAMETSFARLLPTHMQQAFPQNFLTNNGRLPAYNNLNYPQYPG